MTLKLRHPLVPLSLALTAFGLVAAHPASASATIYNFEVQGNGGYAPASYSTTPYDGTGAMAGSGTTWNLPNTKVNGNLAVTDAMDSNGGTSTVGFIVQSDSPVTGPDDGIASNPDQLLSNYVINDKPAGTAEDITFTGLAPDMAFTLDLYSENGDNVSTANAEDGRGAIFNLTASDYTTVLAPEQIAYNNHTLDTSFVEGSNYVQFTGTTDALGDVYATYQDQQYSSGEAEFNGAQISVDNVSGAPEPSQIGMLGLMGLGLGGLLLKARKRNVSGRA